MSGSQAPNDQFVPEDDAVIGRAFKRSLMVIAGVAALVAAVLVLQGDQELEEEVREKDVGPIEDLEAPMEALPTVRFTDVTAAAGIDFSHRNGAAPSSDVKLLPETMGGGAAFLDYDGDGDQDLLLVDSGAFGPASAGNALYRNDGQGRFENVTAASGLGGAPYGMGVAVGDHDGDGDVDVFLTGVGGNRLYRNDPGGFTDVTAAAGVGGSPDEWTTSAGFFDADGDDDLDLFVCHYVRWSPEIDADIGYTLNGEDSAYGSPLNYQGTFSSLYRNDGGGAFTDVSAEAGIQVANAATGAPMGKALGVAFRDLDGDGRTDILVANDTVQNHLFLNEGDCRFKEVADRTGFGFDSNGGATGAMGIDAADFRGDGSLGVCIGNFANESSSLYVRQRGRLRFNDDAMGEGIGSPSRLRLSFGLFFLDYDLDGRLDLLQVNGHLDETINEVQPSQTYRQPAQLFWNQGPEARACFTEVPAAETGDLGRDLVGRGSAYADIDGDGDLDVLLCQVGAPPVLLRNDQDLGRRVLRVRLRQPGMNRDALGARVEVDVNGRTLVREVTATRSYLSQSELPLTFGLGAEGVIERVEVIWPDGARQLAPLPDGALEPVLIERSV